MKFDKYRGDWVRKSRAVTGPAYFWNQITQIVIHYPGADWSSMDFDRNGVLDYRDTAVLMDNTNAYYWNSRGYAIGYNAAADIFGVTWELRGDTYKCAANKGHNDWSFAILVVVDDQAGATPEQIEAVRRLVSAARVLSGKNLPIIGHGALTGAATSCPGGGIRTQLNAGVFEPRPEFPKPVLKRGDNKPEVLVLKNHLMFWGFYKTIRTSNKFGVGLEQAVKKFQKSVKVPETGRWDVKTYDAYVKFVASK
jgi:hypothetical protein